MDGPGAIPQQFEKIFKFTVFFNLKNREIKVRGILRIFVLISCLKPKEILGTPGCGCLCAGPVWMSLHQVAFISTNQVSENYSKIIFFVCDAESNPRAS